MRFWSRLLLIVCMLTGLAAAPAMAFGMPCHRGMDKGMSEMPAMTHSTMSMADHGKAMHHQGKPLPDKSAFACLIHCLGVTAFAPFLIDIAAPLIGAPLIPHLPAEILEGRSLGPALEPPISRFV
jgi:hypothetical protein